MKSPFCLPESYLLVTHNQFTINLLDNRLKIHAVTSGIARLHD